MKKSLAVLSAFVMACALVAGCTEKNVTPEDVAALIDAIYVQERNENTDAQCRAAKEAWDALSDEQKELVSGEYADPDYFGRDTGDASKDDPLNSDGIGENELLVVSFGTSFNDSRTEDIGGIEKALAGAFPDWSVRRAFTSQIIINHVQARDGEKIDNMDQALERAVANGVKNLVIQPTHLMHGAEYDELTKAVEKYSDKFRAVIIAEPLLGALGNDAAMINADKESVAKAVTKEAVSTAGYEDIEAAKNDGVAFVFLGHGTSHTAKVTYSQMQTQMEVLGYENVFIGTVEGEPEETSCENVIKAVKDAGYKKIVLRPLMVVAGDHANNDMAGEDEDSWKSMFTAAGYFESVETQIEGLGGIEDIQKIYIEHASVAMNNKLEDGVYTADFTTDSTMFHVNEANNGKGILTVENGQATIHVSLASKGILNLYCGLAEDAAKAGSVLLNPTVDTVRYSDGMTQEVYGYDIPVPAIDEEFDVAIIGSKGKWYDHKVKVSNPVKTDDTGALNLKTGTYEVQVELTGGSGKASINSPAVLNVGETDAVVRLEWSSPNYDYMIVDGQKYLNINEEGNSVFEIPVSALDEQINVIANTTAMGKPHEIEYVITLHLTGNDNSTSQNTNKDNSKAAGNDTIFEIPEKIGNDLSLSHSLELKYATKFSVDYFVSDADKSQYTLLSVNDDGQYLLVPSDKMDSDLAGLSESASKLGIKLIKQPSDIYLASSQSMDFFVSLGELDRIKFSALAENDWYIDAAKAKMKDGSISYAGKYSAPDYEMLLSSKCDFVIENTMIYHSPEVKEKLENLGLNVMVDGSSYESHPLGRCEWVKLYGALLSCEDKAQKAFDEQVKKFEEIKTAAVNSDKPTIAFFYIASNGTVKVRSNDDYFTKMIELAGGRSAFYDILKDNESSSATVSLSMESFYEAAKDADYIIYNSTVDGEIKSVNDLLNKSELFANFKAVKEDNVYCITKDLFQSAMEIGDIIQDLNKMLVQDENMSFIYKVK